MNVRYQPTFNDIAMLDGLPDEEKIRLEANLRHIIEYHLRLQPDLPIPPSFEEMRFDGDRGL